MGGGVGAEEVIDLSTFRNSLDAWAPRIRRLPLEEQRRACVQEPAELVGRPGRGCATKLWEGAPSRHRAPPTAPGFPAGSLRPASRPPPPRAAREPAGGPSSLTGRGLPFCGHFPGTLKPWVLSRGGRARGVSCGAFPQARKLAPKQGGAECPVKHGFVKFLLTQPNIWTKHPSWSDEGGECFSCASFIPNCFVCPQPPPPPVWLARICVLIFSLLALGRLSLHSFIPRPRRNTRSNFLGWMSCDSFCEIKMIAWWWKSTGGAEAEGQSTALASKHHQAGPERKSQLKKTGRGRQARGGAEPRLPNIGRGSCLRTGAGRGLKPRPMRTQLGRAGEGRGGHRHWPLGCCQESGWPWLGLLRLALGFHLGSNCCLEQSTCSSTLLGGKTNSQHFWKAEKKSKLVKFHLPVFSCW